MALSSTRDVLGLTSMMLDKSDDIYDETRKAVRHFEGRRTFVEFADLRTAAAKGADSGALAAMLQPESPIAVGIHQALVNTTVAQQHVDMLQSNRAAVVAARKEALDEKARSMSEARDKLAADVTARMKAADSDYISKLRELVADNAANAAAAEAAARAAAEHAAAAAFAASEAAHAAAELAAATAAAAKSEAAAAAAASAAAAEAQTAVAVAAASPAQSEDADTSATATSNAEQGPSVAAAASEATSAAQSDSEAVDGVAASAAEPIAADAASETKPAEETSAVAKDGDALVPAADASPAATE